MVRISKVFRIDDAVGIKVRIFEGTMFSASEIRRMCRRRRGAVLFWWKIPNFGPLIESKRASSVGTDSTESYMHVVESTFMRHQ